MEFHILPELLSVIEKDYQSQLVRSVLYLIGNLLSGNNTLSQYCLDWNVTRHLITILTKSYNDYDRTASVLYCFSTIVERTGHECCVNIDYSCKI